jgi:hypothetical protein
MKTNVFLLLEMGSLAQRQQEMEITPSVQEAGKALLGTWVYKQKEVSMYHKGDQAALGAKGRLDFY